MNLSPREPSPLSPREQQVLAWISEGYTVGQIANAFNISVRTVHYHIDEAKIKLRVPCREAAIKYALRLGYLLDAPPLPVITDR